MKTCCPTRLYIWIFFMGWSDFKFRMLFTGFGNNWKTSDSNDSFAKLVQLVDADWKQETPTAFVSANETLCPGNTFKIS